MKHFLFLFMFFSSLAFGQTNIYSYLSGNFSYRSIPPNPSAFGKLWFDQTTNHFYFWNTSNKWQPILDSATGVSLSTANTWTARQTFSKGVTVTAGTVLDSTGATGTSGNVLTSNGANKSPTWQAAATGGNPYFPYIIQKGGTTFYATPGLIDANGSATLTANKLYLDPFVSAASFNAVSISIFVVTGVALDSAELGIFNDTVISGIHQAGSLLADAGAVAVTATGATKTINFGVAPVIAANTLIWLAVLPKASSVILSSPNSATNGMVGMLGFQNANPANTERVAHYETQTFGALPSKAPGNPQIISLSDNLMPLIYISAQ